MDIRSADVEPTIEHGGTCRSYFMFPKETYRAETEGSHLEFVGEFELEPGTALEPHFHDTHEFYYLLRGKATMQIEDEVRVLEVGDLVHIPRNAPHSIKASAPGGFRALAFAVSFQAPGETYTPTTLPPLMDEPTG
jgi:quercetin dioxygenase-like cupin family protein